MDTGGLLGMVTCSGLARSAPWFCENTKLYTYNAKFYGVCTRSQFKNKNT